MYTLGKILRMDLTYQTMKSEDHYQYGKTKKLLGK